MIARNPGVARCCLGWTNGGAATCLQSTLHPQVFEKLATHGGTESKIESYLTVSKGRDGYCAEMGCGRRRVDWEQWQAGPDIWLMGEDFLSHVENIKQAELVQHILWVM